MHTDVLIVGGGLAGIACAVSLAGSGLQVTIVEQEAALCGRARSFRDEHTGDRVDIGPHILVTEYHTSCHATDDGRRRLKPRARQAVKSGASNTKETRRHGHS